jgi:hypothetical protein
MSQAFLTRRRALQSTACGFGYVALAGLAQTASASNPLAPKTPHHRARDEWERRLFGAALDCGVSVPDSALSSDGLYK